MKISVDDKEIFTLSETQKRVIKNDIHADIFDEVPVVIDRPRFGLEDRFKRLKSEWEPRLKDANVSSIPLDEAAFAELVFSRPDYQDRKLREK